MHRLLAFPLPCAHPPITRPFLEIISVPVQLEGQPNALAYDLEWLATLRRTHSLLSTTRGRVTMPARVERVTIEVGWGMR